MLKLRLEHYHDAYMLGEILRSGAYEPEVTALLLHRFKQGDVFLDVGSNNGYFAIIAAAMVGKGGRVMAFEPSGSALERLRDNVLLNGDVGNVVTVCGMALSDRNGKMSLMESKTSDAWSSLSATAGEKTVEATRFDSMFPNAVVNIAKIDVEGHELQVIMGMRETIMTNQGIGLVVEWTPDREEAADLFRFLNFELGMSIFVIRSHSRPPFYVLEPACHINDLDYDCNIWCEKKNNPEKPFVIPQLHR